MPYFPFIDGMRAIAVLSVILFHLGLGVPGGYIGVDIFFVLSGFLITTILVNRLSQPAGQFFAHFYERRARRIIPPLIFMVLLTAVGAYFILLPGDMAEFGKSLRNLVVFFSNFYFSRQFGYFDAPALTKPLLHTWSLAVEEQFYLLFPPLLYVAWRVLSKRAALFAFVILALFAASLAANLSIIETHPSRAFYLPHTRAWELLAGSIVALWGLRFQPGPRMANLFSVAALGGLIACLFLYDESTQFPGKAAIAPVVASAVLIWANLRHTGYVARLLAWKPLVAIGLISYGLYLYHWPPLVLVQYVRGTSPLMGEKLVMLAGVFALAIASYRYIEQPIRSGRYFKRPRSVFLAALAALLVCGSFGVIAKDSSGMPYRFNPAVQRYAAADRRVTCPRTWAEPISKQEICVVGNGDAIKPDFLVWGDSHAQALTPVVQDLAIKHGRTGWFYNFSGCPSLVDAERMDDASNDCAQLAEGAMRIIKHYRIPVVLMVNRWDMYTIGTEAGGDEGFGQPEIHYRGKSGMNAVSDSLRDTREALQKIGVESWLMQQAPAQVANIPTALATAEHFGRDKEALRRPRETSQARYAPVNAMLRQAFPANRIFDPMPYFCPPKETLCYVEREGEPLYSDNDHVSAYGARQLAPLLEPFFTSQH